MGWMGNNRVCQNTVSQLVCYAKLTVCTAAVYRVCMLKRRGTGVRYLYKWWSAACRLFSGIRIQIEKGLHPMYDTAP